MTNPEQFHRDRASWETHEAPPDQRQAPPDQGQAPPDERHAPRDEPQAPPDEPQAPPEAHDVPPDARIESSDVPGDPAPGTDNGAAPEPRSYHEHGTVLLVRRSRTPTLGFWVMIVLAASALIGAIVALVTGITYLAGIAYIAAIGVFFIGLPVAAVLAFIDAIRTRRR